jgi:thiamine-monophosphate kinase
LPRFNEQSFLHQLGLTNPLLRDDVFVTPDHQLFTMDTLVEDTHFSWDYMSPADVGWKAVAVNASDIAATGGMLDSILVALTLPAETRTDDVAAFYTGLQDALTILPNQPTLIGGDTTRGPCWSITIAAIGHMPAGYSAGRRWLAKPGDRVLTTGPHGLSAVGLAVLQANLPGYEACKQAHKRPIPKWQQGLSLAQRGCRYALMDSSDGLADAALKLAHASQVGIELWLNHLPVHAEVNAYATDPLNTLLYGGEDFELVACWPPDLPIPAGFVQIGHVVSSPEPGAWLKRDCTAQAIPLTYQQTYQHF